MAFSYKAWLTASLVSVALLLTGCASLDCPQEWGSSPGNPLLDGCPDLSGTYATRAIEAYPANVEIYPSLNDIFGPDGFIKVINPDKTLPALSDATSTTFKSDRDWLYVYFNNDSGEEIPLTFKRMQWLPTRLEGSISIYHCQKLEQGPALGLEGALLSKWGLFTTHRFGVLYLSKGQDGSLIANYRTGKILFNPISLVYGDWVDSVWWRYPPIESQH